LIDGFSWPVPASRLQVGDGSVLILQPQRVMASGLFSSLRAESTREIENQASHQNDADCRTAEHGAAQVKSTDNE
jgi:hypothetical protein